MTTECILWWGSVAASGYGRLWRGGRDGKVTRAHRLAWEDANQASLLPGTVVMHRCDNPRCVNPKHLTVGAQVDNVRDAMTKGRHKPPTGPQKRWSKLTRPQVEAIRAFAWKGVSTNKAIGQVFGVSEPTVQSVRAHRYHK